MLSARSASQLDFTVNGTPIVVGKGNAGGLPLFTIIQVPFNKKQIGFLSLTEDNGLLSGDVFIDAYNELVRLSLIGTEPHIVDMATYEADFLTNSGKTGKFGLDIPNKTFRIPYISGLYLGGKKDTLLVGQYLEDQMRPITGVLGRCPSATTTPGRSGAFIGSTQVDNIGGGSASVQNVSMDSSLLGSSYSGDTTHPESIVVDFQMKLFGTLTNLSQVDMANVVTQLSAKLDTSVYTSDNSTRIKACGVWDSSGTVSSSSNVESVVYNGNDFTVTFATPMDSTNYIVLLRANSIANATLPLLTKTVNGFSSSGDTSVKGYEFAVI